MGAFEFPITCWYFIIIITIYHITVFNMYRKRPATKENIKSLDKCSTLQERTGDMEEYTEKKTKTSCENCEDLKSFIIDIIKEQTGMNRYNHLQRLYISHVLHYFAFSDKLQQQNSKIMQALATQNVLTKMLVRQEETASNLISNFPIKSDESLIAYNNKINKDNRDIHVRMNRQHIFSILQTWIIFRQPL